MPAEGIKDETTYFRAREDELRYRAGTSEGLSRRQLLKLAAAGVPLLAGLGRWAPGVARAVDAPASPIVKPLPPEWFINYGSNAEMRWDAFRGQGYLVPNERFFVRDHTATPIIDADQWQLSVFGAGLRGRGAYEDAATFDYDHLLKLPSKEIVSFIECAGNGRSFFASQQGTPAAGTQWKLGAIGVARWRGVPLSDVLDRAGLRRKHAVDVMPSGLDRTVTLNGADVGHVRRPVPLAKALDDVLLAYEMNGEPLLPDHGFPVRLVVPGWVGVASIKWVGAIEVSDQPLFSPWNTTQYRLTGATYPPDQPALTNQVVKSAFELAAGASLPAGLRQILTGRSWSGLGAIRQVEISTDGGANWAQARLHKPNRPVAWVRWEYPWTPPAPGPYELRARATDTAGRTQPDTVPFNDGGYVFGAVVRHPVVAVS